MDVVRLARRSLDHFKSQVKQGKWEDAEETLVELKLHLTNFQAVPPRWEPCANANEQLQLARDILEEAVLFSAQTEDDNAFERNFLQLQTYYTDTNDVLPRSSKHLVITGLNLLRLLVQSRIAEFHLHLETLSASDLRSPEVRYATALEQSLMEGAYNKISLPNIPGTHAANGMAAGSTGSSAASVPSPAYIPLSRKILATVRDEIRSISEQAYASLSVDEAVRVMRFASERDLLDFAREEKADAWKVSEDGKRILFNCSSNNNNGGGGGGAGSAMEVNSMELIRNTLHYANQLERII